jgi:hypothetical protein
MQPVGLGEQRWLRRIRVGKEYVRDYSFRNAAAIIGIKETPVTRFKARRLGRAILARRGGIPRLGSASHRSNSS